MHGKKYIPPYLFVFILLCQPARSQFNSLPNEYSFSLLTEKRIALRDSSIHGGIKPYCHFFSGKYVHVPDSHRVFKYISEDAAIDVLFFKHTIAIEPRSAPFKLRLDPLLNLEAGIDLANRKAGRLYNNTRGFVGSGYIGRRVYFETLFAENQSFFPGYLSKHASELKIVPGQGRWKNFKTTGYDYAFSSGFVSLQALKQLNVQFGHGKQKIGHGYRSLLLSDNAFNYPYARFTHQWLKGRLQYSNIYAVLTNLVPAAVKYNPYTERLFQKKAASFQYLSVNVSKSVNFGFFQGMIWQAGDDRNRHHITWQYFNPLIYANLVPYGLNNRNNILVGGDMRIKLTGKLSLYGQWMADDSGQKAGKGACFGYQAGITWFDAISIKNLFLQAEFNDAGGGSYLSPSTATTQAYSHYNQNLAYTPGSGQEFVFIADYKRKRVFVHAQYNYQHVITTRYFNNIVNARLGYVINTAYNLNICMGVNYRMQNFYTFKSLNETNYIYIGLRTSLYNLYYDF